MNTSIISTNTFSVLSAVNAELGRELHAALAGMAGKVYYRMWSEGRGEEWLEDFRTVYQFGLSELIVKGCISNASLLAEAKIALVDEEIPEARLEFLVTTVIKQFRDNMILGVDQIKIRTKKGEFRSYPLLGDLDAARLAALNVFHKEVGIYSEPQESSLKDFTYNIDGQSVMSESARLVLSMLNSVGFEVLPGLDDLMEDVLEDKIASGSLTNKEVDSESGVLVAVRRVLKGIGSGPVYFKWSFDDRFRAYASSVLGITGNKAARGFLLFAKSGPVDMDVIFDCIAREAKFEGTREEGVAMGKAIAASGNFPSKHAETMFNHPDRALCGRDARSSVVQILAAALGNEEGCALSQMTGDSPAAVGGHEAIEAKAHELSGLTIPKGTSKELTSGICYGQSGLYAVKAYLERNPANQLGLTEEIGEALEDALEAVSGVKTLKRLVANKFRGGAFSGDSVSWPTLDGCIVGQTKTDAIVHRAGATDKGGYAATLEHTRAFDDAALARWVLPSKVHSVDGWIAREVVRKCDFPVVYVHDNFFCHSGNVEAMTDAVVAAAQKAVREGAFRQAWEACGLKWRWNSIDESLVTNRYMIR
jgi:hypothetical protein